MKSSIFRLLAVIIVVMVSCSKKETVKPAENPITQFIDTNPSVYTLVSNAGEAEFGIVFTPVLNGKVTQLGVRMPKTSTYRVTLWDATSKTVLSQQLVSQTADAERSATDITAIAVTANTTYIISVSTRAKSGDIKPPFYAAASSNKAIMPFIQGNINLLGFATNGTSSDFPIQVANKTYMLGFADFTFIPD